ncbi:MAG: hypothetical protein ABI543_02200 [Ignavibacteria bacterium]
MKKLIAFIVLILFSLIYFVSSNDSFMKKLAPYRYEVNAFWGADKYRYGDLFGFSFLPQYKFPIIKKSPVKPDQPDSSKINFYCMCDSYVWGFTPLDSLLFGVNRYQRTRWRYGDDISVNMDSSKINFLLIEISERNIRSIFNDTSYVYSKIRNSNNVNKQEFSSDETVIQKIERYVFNPQINQNLEFNLFDYSFFTPVKELKAKINLELFGRTDPEVKISRNKERLFYSATIDSGLNTSSFMKIEDNEIDRIIVNLNAIFKHYKDMGFKFIYLSIIPNPVSVIDPDFADYNMLIDKIQNNKALQIPYLNIYHQLKQNPSLYYYKTDSHWNYDGFELWLAQLNKELIRVYNSK